jgi:monoterpene epsilon-lactone hydrolase
VLVNLHGGGFVSDSGSMLESIPMGSLCRTKVVTVLYRLAPACKFPAAVDDAIADGAVLRRAAEPVEPCQAWANRLIPEPGPGC